MTDFGGVWAPDACTLRLLERPLRLEEFDMLFAHGLIAQERLSPTVLRWTLGPRAELTARDLAAREAACCSFFTFDFVHGGDAVLVDVRVPLSQVEVLDALEVPASAGLTAT